jgi:hypothetical protein
MKQEQVAVIDKRSLAEQVYQYLCDSIIGGRFNYGDTLSTKQLAKELDVSMMPIREAQKHVLAQDADQENHPLCNCDEGVIGSLFRKERV